MSGQVTESYSVAGEAITAVPIEVTFPKRFPLGVARLWFCAATLTGTPTITMQNGQTVAIGLQQIGTYIRIAGTTATFTPAGALVALA